MTMNEGKTGTMSSTINVTPMIDVLLVLLIIFMVIAPSVPRGEKAQVPQTGVGGENNPVVLEVLKGAGGEVKYRINQQAVARQDLSARLVGLFSNRATRALMLKGDDQLSFTEVAEVIDLSHAAGVDHVGLLTPRIQAGQ